MSPTGAGVPARRAGPLAECPAGQALGGQGIVITGVTTRQVASLRKLAAHHVAEHSTACNDQTSAYRSRLRDQGGPRGVQEEEAAKYRIEEKRYARVVEKVLDCADFIGSVQQGTLRAGDEMTQSHAKALAPCIGVTGDTVRAALDSWLVGDRSAMVTLFPVAALHHCLPSRLPALLEALPELGARLLPGTDSDVGEEAETTPRIRFAHAIDRVGNASQTRPPSPLPLERSPQWLQPSHRYWPSPPASPGTPSSASEASSSASSAADASLPVSLRVLSPQATPPRATRVRYATREADDPASASVALQAAAVDALMPHASLPLEGEDLRREICRQIWTMYEYNDQAADIAPAIVTRLPRWPPDCRLSIEIEAAGVRHGPQFFYPPGFAEGMPARDLALRLYISEDGDANHYIAIGQDNAVIPVSPDGNCFYRAVLTVLNGVKRSSEITSAQVAQLRQEMADHVDSHWTELEPFYASAGLSDEATGSSPIRQPDQAHARSTDTGGGDSDSAASAASMA